MDHLIHFANKPAKSWAQLAVCGSAKPGAVTSIPDDVTCPVCRETAAWRDAAAQDARGENTKEAQNDMDL